MGGREEAAFGDGCVLMGIVAIDVVAVAAVLVLVDVADVVVLFVCATCQSCSCFCCRASLLTCHARCLRCSMALLLYASVQNASLLSRSLDQKRGHRGDGAVRHMDMDIGMDVWTGIYKDTNMYMSLHTGRPHITTCPPHDMRNVPKNGRSPNSI